MDQDKIELNGKTVTLENITLEDIEQLFDFDKTILLQHRLELSNEYIETHFPENERLFNRLQKLIKRNIELTDPKTFKNVKDPITYKSLQLEEDEQKLQKKVLFLKRRNTVRKFFKKSKKKSLLDEKLNQLNKELKKTGMVNKDECDNKNK